MSNVLILNSGLNGAQSNSNKLTSLYENMRKTHHLDDNYTVRDLNEQALPHLSQQEMGAWMTAPEDRTPEQQTLARISDELINEIKAHDTIVIGMPMYNMGIPSTFKAYIDRIARAGVTFTYTENGPEGLVKNKRVIVLAARGGQYQGTPFDTQTSYIKNIFGLIGITDVEFVYAEGLNMGEQVAEQAWQTASEQLTATFN
ncbi:FMN-dependent NADH-azoreductase [Thalassotalea atypica]|uniref:FMN-dependent NADH-azoreductase n=1 Tax=Thalassotalea atypica TaxID=2054316 RepID=UPI0025724CFF|nr:NAD(P)H-dependent oxidoreductase [Thalassotalea atypica]